MADHGKRAKVLAVAVAFFVLAAGVGLRIWYVNDTAFTYPVEHHAMGEWVELDGAVIEQVELENTSGYSLRVSNAEILSYQEYLDLYGEEGLVPDGLDIPSDARSIVCLTIDICNDGNASENGGLYLFGMGLMPRSEARLYQADFSLLAYSNRNLADGGLSYIALLENSEFTLHVPYYGSGDYANTVVGTEFELLVSNVPVRNVIDIVVGE